MRLTSVACCWGLVVLASGCPADPTPAETENGSDSTTAAAESTGGTTAPNPTTTDVPGTTSSGSGPSDDTGTTAATDGTTDSGSDSTGSSSGSEGGSDSDSGSSGSESSDTGVTPAPCEAGCIVQVDCGDDWVDIGDCTTACEDNLVEAGMFSPFCQQAWEDVSACLGTLTCEEYDEWDAPSAFPYPCSDEDVALDLECEGQ